MRRRTPARAAVHACAAVALAGLLLAGCGADPAADPDGAGEQDADAAEDEQRADPGDGTNDAAEDAGDGSDGADDGADDTGDGSDGTDAAAGDPDDETDGTDGTGDDLPPVDPAEVGADELGVVPVLMYHQLREDGGSDYDMTPADYRANLEWLFDNGYRPITTSQFVRGDIDVPAGTSPVVLTYDDSTSSQARLTDDGELDPDTALGILVEIAARYEDVEPRASVYVISGSLFGGTAAGEEVLEVLHGHGMELGNHTHTHPSLRSLDAAGVQEELATNVAVVTDLVPDAEVATLSLPLGIFPEDRDLAARGSSAAGSYTHEGILLVGSGPAPSPFDAGFDALAVPRIRTDMDPELEYTSTWWFDIIAESDRWRPYVSDGDPDTISFPAAVAEQLDPAHADRANPY